MHNYILTARPRGSAQRSSLTRDAAALYQVMTELLRAYQFRDRDRLGYHGLTITQCYVLHLLIQRGPLTLNELAAEMHLDKSTLSRMVDGLERKQAVRRTANPADDRSTFIEATRSGTRRHERVEADLVAENAKVLAEFTAPTRRQLLVLIDRLTKAVRARHLEPAD
jgi:MarR family transcriptional regulator, 2-MHQ and catechol-resistance regulon repressor